MNVSKGTKAVYKVLYLIFMMFMYMHILACTWNLTVEHNEEWIINEDFTGFGTPQIFEYYYVSWERTYIKSLYVAFYLFCVGEVCPRTVEENIVAIVLLVSSCIVNGFIIGNMALFMTELNRAQAEFQVQLDTINFAMKSLNIPNNLKREIQEFFISTYGTNLLQKELQDFMYKRLTKSQKVLCITHLLWETIRANVVTK